MAVSAAGLPILLQASAVQLQDLLGALSPGDALKARIVELLPQNQALVSLRGQNVVAQLPASQTFAKGDILSLQVTQAGAGNASTPANLTLKLIATQSAAGEPAGASVGAPAGSAPAGASAAQIEQALSAARLPATSINLSLAQTLARLGAPLDPATLDALSSAVGSLLANENGGGAPASAGPSPQVRQALGEGLAQLKLAGSLASSGEDALRLGQAARALQAALDSGPAVGIPGPGADAPSLLNQAIAKVLAEPSAANVAALENALEQTGAAESSAPGTLNAAAAAALATPAAPGTPNAAAAAAPATPAAPGTSNPPTAPAWTQAQAGGSEGPGAGMAAAAGPSAPPNSAVLPAMREALAQWLGPMNQSAVEPSAVGLAASARSLAAAFTDAAQGSTQRLIAAVQAQSPESPAADIQAAGTAALNRAGDYFASLPAGQGLSGVQAVQAGLATLNLPVPKADLSLLPPETVAESVAWLSARGLPPQRPLVETVSAWLADGRAVLPAAQKALQSAAALPGAVLEARPTLRSAAAALGQALDAAGVDPSGADLERGLLALASAQGLNLESALAGPFESLFAPGAEGEAAAAGAGAPAKTGAVSAPGGSVRESLMRLQNELGNALQAAPAGDTATAAVAGALRDAQAAVRGFNAVPLQAQAAPAFDTLHLPLPVWMNGVLGDGRLSVTWRRGRGRELDDRDPVNVSVALDTESLGPVAVHLQVWRSAASAGVVASDEATARFLAAGADELREGFARGTPFALRSLEFSAGDPAAEAPFQGPEAPRPGLSVSA